MTAIQLTPAQRKDKRADAHHLDPVVMIGDVVIGVVGCGVRG